MNKGSSGREPNLFLRLLLGEPSGLFHLFEMMPEVVSEHVAVQSDAASQLKRATTVSCTCVHAASCSVMWLITALLAARRLPGCRAGTPVKVSGKAADGCAVVSGVWRLAAVILLPRHSLGFFFALHKHQLLPKQSQMQSSQALF